MERLSVVLVKLLPEVLLRPLIIKGLLSVVPAPVGRFVELRAGVVWLLAVVSLLNPSTTTAVVVSAEIPAALPLGKSVGGVGAACLLGVVAVLIGGLRVAVRKSGGLSGSVATWTMVPVDVVVLWQFDDEASFASDVD